MIGKIIRFVSQPFFDKRLTSELFEQYVKETIYKMQSMDASTLEFSAMLAEMMRRLREHNNSEEVDDLPQLEIHLGEEGSKEAAAAFKRTKKFAPTRSVPSPHVTFSLLMRCSNPTVLTLLRRISHPLKLWQRS